MTNIAGGGPSGPTLQLSPGFGAEVHVGEQPLSEEVLGRNPTGHLDEGEQSDILGLESGARIEWVGEEL